MATRVGMEVSIAAAEAVKQANADIIAAYPITPQTHIVEHLSELVNDGELDAEFIPVESEHSAMSVCAGSSAAGARTFTCTSSQGLILMSEIVYAVASLRLPMLMILANRSLNSPLSIWNDHSDVMSVRDCGWIQVFMENGQEVYDHVFIGFRVAEDRNVIIPFMMNIDGFMLTHVIEPIGLLEQEVVDRYLPPFQPLYRLHPNNPVTMGAFGPPILFTEAKKAQDEAFNKTMPHIIKAWQEFGDLTGRYYHPIETYRTDEAKIVIITQGSLGETASIGIDMMREEKEPVGLVKIRLWRPFPFAELREAVKEAELVVVMDRAISYGGPGGPLAGEVRSALYPQESRPRVANFIIGLGGRDVAPEDFVQMVQQAKAQPGEWYEIYGVRE
ncbi:MAG: pyruvate ferredoxin oxidoreductase [Deltaproteobacteria bacterium]|nr:MAG: pyruvate ferredoxin oxidoreductase [Deltaproteobacteria bacterium]